MRPPRHADAGSGVTLRLLPATSTSTTRLLTREATHVYGDGESLIACTVGEEGRTEARDHPAHRRCMSGRTARCCPSRSRSKGRIFARTVGTDVQQPPRTACVTRQDHQATLFFVDVEEIESPVARLQIDEFTYNRICIDL